MVMWCVRVKVHVEALRACPHLPTRKGLREKGRSTRTYTHSTRQLVLGARG